MQLTISEPAHFIGLIVVLRLSAIGAAVNGEPRLIAGRRLPPRGVGLVQPGDHKDHVQVVLHLLAEVGGLVLFQFGLETISQDSEVGLMLACIAPFGLGYGVCWLLGLDTLVSLVVAASLTATSVDHRPGAGRPGQAGRARKPDQFLALPSTTCWPDGHRGVRCAGRRRRYAWLACGVVGMAFGFIGTLAIGWFVEPLVQLIASRTRSSSRRCRSWGLLLAFGLAFLADVLGISDDWGVRRAVAGRTPAGQGDRAWRRPHRPVSCRCFSRHGGGGGNGSLADPWAAGRRPF